MDTLINRVADSWRKGHLMAIIGVPKTTIPSPPPVSQVEDLDEELDHGNESTKENGEKVPEKEEDQADSKTEVDRW
jgi:hypothetical protein